MQPVLMMIPSLKHVWLFSAAFILPSHVCNTSPSKTITGPFAAGDQITSADATLFPTMAFCDFILPKYFGWKGLWETRPKLKVGIKLSDSLPLMGSSCMAQRIALHGIRFVLAALVRVIFTNPAPSFGFPEGVVGGCQCGRGGRTGHWRGEYLPTKAGRCGMVWAGRYGWGRAVRYGSICLIHSVMINGVRSNE